MHKRLFIHYEQSYNSVSLLNITVIPIFSHLPDTIRPLYLLYQAWLPARVVFFERFWATFILFIIKKNFQEIRAFLEVPQKFDS